jgi:flagellar assembly factor FliW
MNTMELSETEQTVRNAEQIIRLPLGLLGFEQYKEYSLVTNADEEPFMWLKIQGNPAQSFLVLSPFLVLPEYLPDISTDDAEFLGIASPEDVLLLNIVTLRGHGQPTVNLKGPVAINRHTMIGKQVIPNNVADYTLHHPLATS